VNQHHYERMQREIEHWNPGIPSTDFGHWHEGHDAPDYAG
jgi:hypothetical protein